MRSDPLECVLWIGALSHGLRDFDEELWGMVVALARYYRPLTKA